MDDLLRDFVVETTENIDVVDNELVRFEQDPNNKAIIAQIFRLVHTIKGTCGFLGLPRLEALTHAAETAIDRFRDGAPVTREAVTLILSTIDRIKLIMAELDRSMEEPSGHDDDLIQALVDLMRAQPKETVVIPVDAPAPETDFTEGKLVYQVLERKLRPGEVSLDELERAFRETEPEADEFTFRSLQKAGLAAGEPAAEAEANNRPAVTEETLADGFQVDSLLRNGTIRVPVETLEHLMTMVSELVLTRNQLLEISRREEGSLYKAPLQRLSHVTAELQENVMKTRMQPIGNAWAKLPRLVRDLCEDLGKDIELTMTGADTEIDRQILELIKDPMLHMIRNAADHGVETADERVKRGKPAKARINVMAAQEGGYIVLSISDDGSGLDLARIAEKAVNLGLTTEAAVKAMTDQQVAKFIFHAGFSTAEKLTNVSGRGVGMDVVRNNIEQIGGVIDVKSTPGQGTTVAIKIPLTLAIAAALIVESGGQRFALPQMAVTELVRPNGSSEARIEQIHNVPVLRLRERLLPLIELSRILGIDTEARNDWSDAYIVVCQVGSVVFGLGVESVLQTEEIVVKPLSARIRHLACYSGATILGDGSVIMILDPSGLAQNVGTIAEAHNDNAADASGFQRVEAAGKTSFLVFRAGAGSPKAVPLALVTRLEEIDVARIEHANGLRAIQYRGRLMRLITFKDEAQVAQSGTQPVLVFSTVRGPVGLVVDQIIDIIDDKLEIGMRGKANGILGTAIIRERATDIIDVAYFMPEITGANLRQLERMQRLLLVEKSEFLRAMLAPVLQAAGFKVQSVASFSEAQEILAQGAIDHAVVNVEDATGFALSETAKRQVHFIGLASRASADLIEQARTAGFHDVVGMFDREGLLASLGALNASVGEAA